MPNYNGAPGSAAAMYPGGSVQLFANEAPAATQSSIAVNIPPSPTGDYSPLAFDFEYTANPNTDTVAIQGAMTDTDSLYQTLYTSPGANKSSDGLHDYYSDIGRFKFYRAQQVARGGTQKQTVTISR